MYGKVHRGAVYQPYRITSKKAEAPGCKFSKKNKTKQN